MSSQPSAQKRARHQLSQVYRDALPTPSSPTRPGSPILIDSHSEGSTTAENDAPLWTGEELTNRRHVISIDTLPDDVLLEIFNFHGHYVDDPYVYKREQAWQRLVHVCRRWRCIVFGSPRHLNLQLVCWCTTPVKDMLDFWPALPLSIRWTNDYLTRHLHMSNTIAALQYTDRVCQIALNEVRSYDLDMLLEVMQQPFPELTHLELLLVDETAPVVPDSFLGGSVPRLEYLELEGIPFPGLPKILLSATHLVTLYLINIPHSGYISPDGMVAALSTLTSLEQFSLKFESPRSCPDQANRRPPFSTRSVLPVLTSFRFKGVSEYLDDLVAWVDAPQLNKLEITFFNDTVFDTPQLVRFISYTPMSKELEKASITLADRGARVSFSSLTSHYADSEFKVTILCKGLDWQLSSLEQVCISCLPPLSILADLYFHEAQFLPPDWKGSVENGQWLDLFRSFMAVKNLYLSKNFASRIATVFQELDEGSTTDIFPALKNFFLKGLDEDSTTDILPDLKKFFLKGLDEGNTTYTLPPLRNSLKGLGSSGSVQEILGRFIAMRQVTNQPIDISPWTDTEEGEYWDY